MAGNPNPSPATRFKPGNPGGGKTSEQKRMEYEAAEMAARIRHKMLSVMAEKLDAGTDALEMLSGDALRLFRDSEDRAHGTPKQSVEQSGPDGGPIEHAISADAAFQHFAALLGRAHAATQGSADSEGGVADEGPSEPDHA